MTKTILQIPAGEFKARCLKLMDVTIHGDIVGPIEGVDWHAERGILFIGEDEDQR